MQMIVWMVIWNYIWTCMVLEYIQTMLDALLPSLATAVIVTWLANEQDSYRAPRQETIGVDSRRAATIV